MTRHYINMNSFQFHMFEKKYKKKIKNIKEIKNKKNKSTSRVLRSCSSQIFVNIVKKNIFELLTFLP